MSPRRGDSKNIGPKVKISGRLANNTEMDRPNDTPEGYCAANEGEHGQSGQNYPDVFHGFTCLSVPTADGLPEFVFQGGVVIMFFMFVKA